MDPTEAQKQTEQKTIIAQADPVTLVTAARSGLYELGKNQRDDPAFWALEEVITRFEQASRTQLGVSNYAQMAPTHK